MFFATRIVRGRARLRAAFLRLVALAAALALTCPGLTSAHSAAPVRDHASAAALSARDLTGALHAAAARYRAAAPTHRSATLADVVSLARRRHDALAALLATDPGEVVRNALAADEIAGLPREAAPYLERAATEEGDLAVYHVDDRDPARSEYRYLLATAAGTLSLHFATRAPSLATGTRVRASGVRIDDALALGGNGNVKPVKPAPAPATLGAQRTLVILVDFADGVAPAYSPLDAQRVVFGDTSNFLLENSYQQTWLEGDVVGWYTIAASAATCDTGAIAAQAQAAATAAGVAPGTYAHLVYAFPQNACGWWGLSSVGGTPSQTWITGSLELAVAGHELGHALGLWHSHALDCGTQTVAASCASVEYGDVFDKMGGTTSPGHFNSFQKERIGWLNAGASPPIATVTSGGTYTIEALETPGSAPKALKIPKSIDPVTGARTWYYVEARKPAGFDAFLASVGSSAANGVLIRTGSDGDGNSSYLVDATPLLDTSVWEWYVDAPLVAGRSFTDPDTGTTISTAWASPTAVGVSVDFAAPANVATITVAADRASYLPGQSVALTASVVSNGSPVAGASVSFSVTKSNGARVSATATTASNGRATYTLKLGRRDPAGLYNASAVALAATASTSFNVQ